MSKIKLPESANPYSGKTPYEYLGIPPTANGRAIRDAFSKREEEILFSNLAESEKNRLRAESQEKRAQLSDLRSRVAIDIFLPDTELGLDDCRKQAAANEQLQFDFATVFKGSEQVQTPEPELPAAAPGDPLADAAPPAMEKDQSYLHEDGLAARVQASIRFEI